MSTLEFITFAFCAIIMIGSLALAFSKDKD